MPDHIAFLLRHAAIGAGIAAGFVALLLWQDVAGLWHLVTHTAEGPFAVVLLWAFCTITFGSAQMGIRIMMLGDDQGPRGGRRDAVPHTAPVPVREDK